MDRGLFYSQSIFYHFLLLSATLYSASAIASCTKNADLIVHQETITHNDFSFQKILVNKSAPVQITYDVRSTELQADSLSWLHNNEPIKIDDKPNQEVYYTIETLQDSILVGLHFRTPTARVTGNWTLIAKTTDEQEHRAICFVTSLPVLKPRLGAARGQEGKPMEVVCEVDSYPPPSRIRWQRLEERDGNTKLVPVVNATFKPHNGIEGAVMEWSDATGHSGFYFCQAISDLGVDSILVEVRVKGMKAILWPVIGILIQLAVLLVIIIVYERNMAKRRKAEEAKSADLKSK